MTAGKVEQPRRLDALRAMIQRRGRALWPAVSPRRLWRQSEPALLATPRSSR
jgi:hypothetical protein